MKLDPFFVWANRGECGLWVVVAVVLVVWARGKARAVRRRAWWAAAVLGLGVVAWRGVRGTRGSPRG